MRGKAFFFTGRIITFFFLTPISSGEGVWMTNWSGGEGGGKNPRNFPIFFFFSFLLCYYAHNRYWIFQDATDKNGHGATHTRARKKKKTTNTTFLEFFLFLSRPTKNEEAHFGHTKETSYITFFYLLIQILRPGDWLPKCSALRDWEGHHASPFPPTRSKTIQETCPQV